MTEDVRPPLVVTADLPCRRCGYPLRGRPVDSRCPECGLAVEETLRSSIDLSTLELAEPTTRDPRHVVALVPLLGLAAFLGSAAGLALPVSVAFAPVGFEPSGFGTAGGLAAARLDPVVRGVGLASAVAATVILGSIVVRRAAGGRPLIAVITAGVLLLLAAILGIAPAATGFTSLAEAATHGIGSLIRGGGRVPATAVLVALAVDIVRSLGVGFLVIGLADRLQALGARSELYRQAGQGRQGPVPFLAATMVVMATQIGWLAAAAWTGLGGFEQTLDAVPWPYLWLFAAAIATLGCGYLVANALWAVAPWRRADPRLATLVGPAECSVAPQADDPAAGMADDPRGDRSA